MGIEDLSSGDFEYLKAYNSKMRAAHEKGFKSEIDPDLMRCFYRGYHTKEYRDFLSDPLRRSKHTMTLTKIFANVNTIQPNLYYQNPKIYCVPDKGANPSEAAVITAAMNELMRTTHQKQENQSWVMNAYFFGIGWKKLGYRTSYDMNTASQEVPMLPQDEGVFNTSENPDNVLIDHKGTWNNHKVITHRLKRTLDEIAGNQDYNQDAIEQIRSKNGVTRGSVYEDWEIDVNLNEMMWKTKQGIYVLTYLDESNLPLKYEKLGIDELPWVPLVFTNEPDVLYPISHMRVASHLQEWTNKIATLIVDKIGKSRDQIAVWEDALANGADQALQANKIGGVVKFKKPLTSGVIQNLTSSPVTADLFQMLGLSAQTLTENMGTNEQRVSGKSKNKTLGQDEMADMGTQIRESGMLDKVRDQLIRQKEIEGKIIQKYGVGEMRMNLDPSDFTGQEEPPIDAPVPMEFMTQKNPMPINNFVKSDSFNYELNIYEAIKPDKKSLAAEYDEAMMVYSNPLIEDSLLRMNKRVRIDLIAEKRGKTFEYIYANEFIETLDPMQTAQLQAMKVLQARGGEPPQSAETKMQQMEATSAMKQQENSKKEKVPA